MDDKIQTVEEAFYQSDLYYKFITWGSIVLAAIIIAVLCYFWLSNVAFFEKRKKEIGLGLATCVLTVAAFLFMPIVYVKVDMFSAGGVIQDAIQQEKIRTSQGPGMVQGSVHGLSSDGKGSYDLNDGPGGNSYGVMSEEAYKAEMERTQYKSPAFVDTTTDVLDWVSKRPMNMSDPKKFNRIVNIVLVGIPALVALIIIVMIARIILLIREEKEVKAEADKREHLFEYQPEILNNINKQKR